VDKDDFVVAGPTIAAQTLTLAHRRLGKLGALPPLKGQGNQHMATKSLNDVEASSVVIPAEATRPSPGSRNPVTRSASNNIEAGGYWVPARRKPGVAGLAWPG
jgi:hypothetical protein